MDLTGLYQLFHFHDRNLSCLGSIHVKVACCATEDEVPVRIALPRLDECEIARDAFFHDVVAAFESAYFSWGTRDVGSAVFIELDRESAFLLVIKWISECDNEARDNSNTTRTWITVP